MTFRGICEEWKLGYANGYPIRSANDSAVLRVGGWVTQRSPYLGSFVGQIKRILVTHRNKQFREPEVVLELRIRIYEANQGERSDIVGNYFTKGTTITYYLSDIILKALDKPLYYFDDDPRQKQLFRARHDL